MVVCKFWEQGNCRYGQNCRFEHPSGGSRTQGGNRFAAFNNSSGGGFGGAKAGVQTYGISKEVIQRDLTDELPQWIFSAYGPGRDAPEQLFGGPAREQSFEEMRVAHCMAEASGSSQQAIDNAQQLYQQAQQQIQTAMSDLDGAIKFVLSAENNHPNRIDICKQNTQDGATGGFGKQPSSAIGSAQPFSSNGPAAASSNPFSQNAQTASPFGGSSASSGNPFGQQGQQSGGGAFGQTSALGQGQKPSAFGAPAFGQPSQPSSAFGQPSQPTSAFGKPAGSTPAFGQPSQPTSAFGQASQSSTSSAFGQTSALGQTSSPFGAPAFGQASQPSGGQSAFGQPSAMGQKPSPFSSAGNTSGQSPFGGGGGGNSGASPFGSAGNNSTSASPFSQAAPNSADNKPASPFGQSASSPFGQTSQAPTSSPFGQPAQPSTSSPFGQSSQPATTSPFGQAPQASQNANPFGQKSDAQQPSAFGSQPTAALQSGPFSQNQPQQNATSPFGQASGSGSFGGNAAAANPFGGMNTASNAQSPAAAPSAGAQAEKNPYPPESTKRHPPLSSYASKGMNGQLGQWKGNHVSYKDGVPGYQGSGGAWTKIWFPDGPPNYYKDTELPVEAHDEKSKAQWKTFEQTGRFDGEMPELPPPREVCLWDI